MTKVSGYTPTADQIKAQQERRAAQAAAKEARKNKSGGKTVKGKNGYESVQITPENVAKKQARRAEQATQQQAKAQNRFGGKTIFDKAKGEYVAKPASEVKADYLAKEAKKVKGSRFSLSGLGKYAKKGGKIGLVIGLGAGIAAGVAALAKWGYDKFFGSDDSKETNPEVKAEAPADDKKTQPQKTATPAPATKTPEDKAPEDKKPEDKKPEDKKADGEHKAEKPKSKSKAPAKTPVAVPAPKAEESEETEETGKAEETDKAEKSEETGKADKADKAEETDKADKTPETKTEAGEVHKVKLGDNVWNIAKKHLKEQNGVKPTNAEILKHTKEIMELNNLEFEADGKLVIIKPGQELKLTA